LLAAPLPELLMLDEPAPNRGLRMVRQRADAPRSYQGALIVISNEDTFLSRLDMDLVLVLDHDGALNEISASGA
jgi:ATPase subunit of ABC transporter with duplicated ATPase domains